MIFDFNLISFLLGTTLGMIVGIIITLLVLLFGAVECEVQQDKWEKEKQ